MPHIRCANRPGGSKFRGPLSNKFREPIRRSESGFSVCTKLGCRPSAKGENTFFSYFPPTRMRVSPSLQMARQLIRDTACEGQRKNLIEPYLICVDLRTLLCWLKPSLICSLMPRVTAHRRKKQGAQSRGRLACAHRLCISRSEWNFSGSSSLDMRLSHLSLQIKCADSDTMILNSLFSPVSG